MVHAAAEFKGTNIYNYQMNFISHDLCSSSISDDSESIKTLKLPIPNVLGSFSLNISDSQDPDQARCFSGDSLDSLDAEVQSIMSQKSKENNDKSAFQTVQFHRLAIDKDSETKRGRSGDFFYLSNLQNSQNATGTACKPIGFREWFLQKYGGSNGFAKHQSTNDTNTSNDNQVQNYSKLEAVHTSTQTSATTVSQSTQTWYKETADQGVQCPDLVLKKQYVLKISQPISMHQDDFDIFGISSQGWPLSISVEGTESSLCEETEFDFQSLSTMEPTA
ncbi:hypothetical protein ACOME3_004803 [Neoechinorhynchus agilis]